LRDLYRPSLECQGKAVHAAAFVRLTKFRAFGEQNLLFIAMRENKPTAMLVFDPLTNLYLYKYLYVREELDGTRFLQ